MRKSLFLWLTAALLFEACGPTATRVASRASYDEDLSIYREKFQGAEIGESTTIEDSSLVTVKPDYLRPTGHIAYELDSVLSIMRDARKNVSYLNGFTIQLYSGNDRDRASNIRAAAANLITGVSPKISYEQPNYKVKIGKYYTRLEANKPFNILKTEFSRAVLIPAKISIETE